MRFVTNIVVSTLAVYLVAHFMPGVIMQDEFSALLVALALAFLNAFVKPLLTLLTIPFTLFSFGLFLLVINAFIIMLADKLVSGFEVKGFWPALWFSLVLSLTTGLMNQILGNGKTIEVRYPGKDNDGQEC